MKSIDECGEMIMELGTFVAKLEPAVQLEAFRFLLDRETGGGVSRRGRLGNERGISPQELLRSSGRVKLTQKAEVLIYWLETDQGKESVSTADLKSVFETAREKAPRNPSDVLSSLVASGKLMHAEKVGTSQKLRLTTTAINEVELWIKSGQSVRN